MTPEVQMVFGPLDSEASGELVGKGRVKARVKKIATEKQFRLDQCPNLVEYMAPDFDEPMPPGGWGDYENILSISSRRDS